MSERRVYDVNRGSVGRSIVESPVDARGQSAESCRAEMDPGRSRRPACPHAQMPYMAPRPLNRSYGRPSTEARDRAARRYGRQRECDAYPRPHSRRASRSISPDGWGPSNITFREWTDRQNEQVASSQRWARPPRGDRHETRQGYSAPHAQDVRPVHVGYADTYVQAPQPIHPYGRGLTRPAFDEWRAQTPTRPLVSPVSLRSRTPPNAMPARTTIRSPVSPLSFRSRTPPVATPAQTTSRSPVGPSSFRNRTPPDAMPARTTIRSPVLPVSPRSRTPPDILRPGYPPGYHDTWARSRDPNTGYAQWSGGRVPFSGRPSIGEMQHEMEFQKLYPDFYRKPERNQ